MTLVEFSDQFDLHYNNITSNQAPGCTEYEKSVFLTKAQDEIVKNYFTANSKGNNIGQGFDDSAKRQADFSVLMKTATLTTGGSVAGNESISYTYTYKDSNNVTQTETISFSGDLIDDRGRIFPFPTDVFIVINEALTSTASGTTGSKGRYQVIPLKYDEYTRLMSKPYKRPLKNQAWRLINNGAVTLTTNSVEYTKIVEIITVPEIQNDELTYHIRYIRRPRPIIVGNLDGLTIGGQVYDATKECELDPILHEDILQRAVELAKVAWTATGQDNTQVMLQAGQRSE